MEREPDNLSAELSAWLDGELPEERARAVEQWLAASPEGRREAEALRAVSSQLRALPRAAAPAALAETLRQQAERVLPAELPPQATGLHATGLHATGLPGTGVRRRPGRLMTISLRTGALAAALLVGLLAGYQMFGQRDTASIFSGVEAPLPGTEPDADGDVAVLPSARQLHGRGQPAGKERAVESAAPPPADAFAGKAAPDAVDALAGADERAAPEVRVWVTPGDAGEHARVAYLLASWPAAGGAPLAEGVVAADSVAARGALWQEQPAQQADASIREGLYEVSPEELGGRIAQLDSSVGTRIRVQMDYTPGQEDVLAAALSARGGRARGAPETSMFKAASGAGEPLALGVEPSGETGAGAFERTLRAGPPPPEGRRDKEVAAAPAGTGRAAGAPAEQEVAAAAATQPVPPASPAAAPTAPAARIEKRLASRQPVGRADESERARNRSVQRHADAAARGAAAPAGGISGPAAAGAASAPAAAAAASAPAPGVDEVRPAQADARSPGAAEAPARGIESKDATVGGDGQVPATTPAEGAPLEDSLASRSAAAGAARAEDRAPESAERAAGDAAGQRYGAPATEYLGLIRLGEAFVRQLLGTAPANAGLDAANERHVAGGAGGGGPAEADALAGPPATAARESAPVRLRIILLPPPSAPVEAARPESKPAP